MDDLPTLQTVGTGVRRAAEALWVLIEVGAIIAGFWFLVQSVKRLRDAGTDKRWGLGNAAPLALAGVLSIYLARTIDVSDQTLYATQDIWLYPPSAEDWSSAVIAAVIQIVRVIGLIGFVRGLGILRYTDHESSLSLGAVSRALFFIVGGIAAINILLTTQVVIGTLGLDSPLNPQPNGGTP